MVGKMVQVRDAARKKSAPKRSPRAQQLLPIDLIEAAIVLQQREPGIVRSVSKLTTATDRACALGNTCYDTTKFRHNEPGEISLTAFEGGLRCQKEGRDGTITWLELVAELFDEEEDESPMSTNGHGARHNGPSLAAAPKIAAARNGHKASTASGQAAAAAIAPGGSPVAEGSPSLANASGSQPSLETRMIAVDLIDPNPWQPRTDFAQPLLESLARSLREDGQQHPLVVRFADAVRYGAGRYQVADGERRLRAAKWGGIHALRAEVREISDGQMAELAIVTELHREGLNPIERARGLAQLKKLHGYSQEQLAQKFDCGGQAMVSIMLRLLELPAAWQQRIASGKLSVSHARSVLPLAKHAKLLSKLLHDVDKGNLHYDLDKGEFGSLSQWRGGLDEFYRDVGKRLDGDCYSNELSKRVAIFTPTPEQLAKLDVIEVDDRDGEPVRLALNETLFKQLQSAHEVTLTKKSDKQADKQSRSDKAAAMKLSPAERKQNADNAAKVFKNRLAAWKERWIRRLVHVSLEATGPDSPGLIAVALFMAADRGHFHHSHGPCESLNEALGHKRWIGLGELLDLPERTAKQTLLDTVRGWLRFEPGSSGAGTAQKDQMTAIGSDDLVSLATALGVDLAAAWKKEAAGWLTGEWLDLHAKDQLADLVVECHPARIRMGDQKKSELVAQLLESVALRNELPPEIAASQPWPITAKSKAASPKSKVGKARK